jgi:hypothetical protein
LRLLRPSCAHTLFMAIKFWSHKHHCVHPASPLPSAQRRLGVGFDHSLPGHAWHHLPLHMPSSAPPLPPTLPMPLGPLGLTTLERRQHYKEETRSRDQIRFLASKALQGNRRSDDVSSAPETEDWRRVGARSPPCCVWRMGLSTFRF